VSKNEFLNKLRKLLGSMPQGEIDDILYDYEEHFRMGMKDGKTEDEIIRALGDPSAIAKQFKADYMFTKAETTTSISNMFRAVFASISLGLFNIIFVLGPFFGLVGVLVGLFAAAFAITIGGIGVFLATIFSPLLPSFISVGGNPALNIFASIGISALGLLFFIGDLYIGRFFYACTIRYLKMNLRIIMNRGQKNEF